MIRKILVALDESRAAAGVFDAAAEIAIAFDAAIVPLRVIDVPPEFPAAAAGSLRDSLPEHLERVAKDDLAKITGRNPRARVVAPLVVAGEPWRAILEQAETHDVDLIVLGSHGYQGLDRLLGTTAGSVANRARRNVLVVHRPPTG